MKAWIARDECGLILMYPDKPIKRFETDMWESAANEFIELDSNQFPSVKWEDEEPTEVELIIKPMEPIKKEITYGWVCPKCGHVYSPSIIECVHCNYKTITCKGGSLIYPNEADACF